MRARPRHILGFLAVSLMVAGFTGTSVRAFTLEEVQATVRRDYPGVPQLATTALAKRLAGSDETLLLLDVREDEEFAVSRLQAATRVDPGIWRGTFLGKFEAAVEGRTVVFYCSVGVRSSRLAARVKSALLMAGATAVYNLDGGIFAWHNERRALMNAEGATDYVHPFDRHWGKLLTRPSLARTRPGGG